jgi:hypothetical protein
MRFLVPCLALLLVPSTAAAAEETEKPTRFASVTFSPIHLVFPIVEVTAEFAITPKIGVAGILGAGTVKLENSRGETVERLRAWELGAHFNYYVIGTFDHGMQLGVEALYLKVSRPEGSSDQLSVSGAGLALGPYAGYKIIAGPGFTFEANLGVQYVAVRAEASNSTTTATASEKRVIPLLNLNVGWSF